MPDIATLIQHGTSNIWIFIPSAIMLGALHGLEPGHSKTMMAAFIVAIRGTVTQAVLLGLAATFSHTAIVWGLALAGMHFGSELNMEAIEPYFQLVSAVLIITIALWMILRTWKRRNDYEAGHTHLHEHGHSHDASRVIDTGHGIVHLNIFEEGVSSRFRLHAELNGGLMAYAPNDIRIETRSPDGSINLFTFINRDDFMESAETIAGPHEFTARLRLSHGNHSHDYDVEFVEHGHSHPQSGSEGLDVTAPGYQDPHELAHANDIRRRFSSQNVSTGQIIMFGLTGGLIPCPASVTVLLLCLQLKKIALGALLVLCFSIGLAITMVTAGVVAALSMNQVSKRWSGFTLLAQRAPYFSGAIIILIGLYIGYNGLLVII